MKSVSLGLSPCPNDTFIFHALLHGQVRLELADAPAIAPYFADVERLNERALAGDLPFSKLSAGVLPCVLDKYAVLSAGAALGFGCGPLLVARRADIDPQTAVIAIPGKYTTAARLLALHGGFSGLKREMLFSAIMPAIAAGEVDAGVIIHEGRFTYAEHGLVKLLDLGEWWEAEYSLPLPLGVIAARRDVDKPLARAMRKAIAQSIERARANPEAAREFIRKHAQELDDEVTAAHIRTFVTDYSLDLRESGRHALEKLLGVGGDGIFLD